MTKEQALEQIKKLSQELTAKFKAGVFDAAAYSAAYNKLNDALYLLNHDKSPDTVIASVQSVKDLLSSGMTQEEYDKQKSAMYKKYKDGEITNYAYIQWKKQNNPANQPKSGAVSAPATAKAQTPAPKNAAPVAAKNAGKTAEDILGFKIPDLISDTTNYTNILIAALNGGTITQAQYDQAIKKVIAASKKWQKQSAAPAGMTQAEYDAAKSEMYKKYKNGEITNYAYIQWKKQNNPANQAGNGAPATSATKGGASAGTGTKDGNGAITKAQSDAIKDLLDNAVDNGELSPNASVEKKKMLLQMKNDGKTYDEIAAALGIENGKLKNKAITESEWKGLQAELQKQYADLKISWDKFNDLAFDLKQVYQNGGTLEEAKQLIQGKPQTGMTDAEKDTLTNIINAHATGGTIDYDDANALFDMVDKMQKDGKNTTEALQTINSVVDMIDQNGMTAEDAIQMLGLGNNAGKAMTKAEKIQLSDELDKMFHDGDITEDEVYELDDKLTELFKKGASVLDAQYELGMISPEEYAAAGGKKQPPKAMTHDEYIKLWEELNKQKKAGKLTPEKYKEYGNSLDAMYAQKATLDAAKQAIHMAPMTGEEMLEIGKQLSDKYNAGKITWEEFNAMNDTVMNMKAQKATLADVQAAVGLDPGSLAKEKAIDDLEAELKDVYGQAAKEMQKAWDDFSASYAERLNKKYQDYQDGKITKDEYDEWVKGQMAKSDQMLAQIDQLTGVVSNANKKALGMINGEQLGVFAENANWQAYKLTKDANMNLTFAIYDEHTVEKLIRDKPELLPRKQLNGKKDAAWNQDKIAKSMVQGILQGESIPKLARRVAVETAGTNMNAMVRYARTAMVAAQNSGRMEMLHRAEGMGIKCKKCWLATLDSRTRDSHQKMDGVKVDIDKKFPNGLMYPGDPEGDQAEVWNCRCTLTYEYEGFPADPANNERRDNESGALIADMDYPEWKAAKKGSELNNLNIAKVHLAEVQKSYVKNKVSETKKYEGIWKEPVTLADYPDKKASIAAKRDYYDQEIQKYEDAQANGASWATDEKIKELKKKLKQLNEFELNGGILEKRNAALKAVQDIYDKVGYQKNVTAPSVAPKKAKKTAKKAAAGSGGTSAVATGQTPAGLSLSAAGAKATPFSPDAYSKERKDKALWTTDKRKVDDIMRKKTGEMWLKASREERTAIHEYTYTYKKFNEPLRGIEYGTSRYLGVGKTDLNAGSKRSGRKLNAITDLLNRCSYDHDMWLNRGVRFGGMDKFFNVPMNLLENGTESQLQKALIGTTPTEYAFGSMGSAKGEGFSGDIIMNIYAPKGTKMLFAEPWSYYGRDKHGNMHDMEGANWNGKDTQPSYGTEFETILQQGTQFRVTKVTRRGKGTIFVDLEVINQDNQQRWKP